jgi:hypothetical protein
MVHTYFAPEWFLTYEFFLHLAFALITLAVSFYSFKVYNLIKRPQPKLFGIAFASYFIGCFIQGLLEFFAITNLNSPVRTLTETVLDRLLDILGVYVQMIFFTVGLVTLTYMTLKVRSARIYSLLLITALLSLIGAASQVFLFYVLSSFFLAYILIHYLFNYINNRQPNTLRALIAFILLFLGNLVLIFSIKQDGAVFYVVGHFIEGVAFLIILINLILVVKNDQETRQTANNTANP